MRNVVLRLLVFASTIGVPYLQAEVGAVLPWTTYEAEAMTGNGVKLGPAYEPHRVETESSGQKCVQLTAAGQFVEFTAITSANSLVLRYCLPDSVTGNGTSSTLALFVNGKQVRTLSLTSRHSWLYGNYPFSNHPQEQKPRNFYDELRVRNLEIAQNDIVRLQKTTSESECIVDLVDLENCPPAVMAPAGALSIREFGASGKGETDDTEALKSCVAAAKQQRRIVWIPAGVYKVTGDIRVPSAITIQGAGMWHTTFVGDEQLYRQSGRRVRFKLTGTEIHLADFAIVGNLNYRDDNEPNDGIVVAGCTDSSIARVWLEHTKVGVWVYNGTRLHIEGCRFRNLLADGVNLCVGTSGTIVENCSARGTGDDCFAIWPAASDQGYVGQTPLPGNNVIRRCTGQLTFLANGAALYGGANNLIEDCLFTDIASGCGILISTTFPTSDEDRKIDNNFSGETAIRRCLLVRCGGYDHSWAWRGSLQICADRRSISGLRISEIDIRDSFSDGITIVAPGSHKGEGTLSNARMEKIVVSTVGIGAPGRHEFWIRDDAIGGIELAGCAITDVQNDSTQFALHQQ